MVSKLLLAASAFFALTHAQTIVTSSASSVAASTTESQVMPPAATASFNPASINPTTACKRQVSEVSWLKPSLTQPQSTGATLNLTPALRSVVDQLPKINATM